VPFSALAGPDVGEQGPSVPPERFRGPEDRWAGHWATPPHPWGRPDHELLSAETRDWIVAAIDALPQLQRQVITLRDASALDITALGGLRCERAGARSERQRRWGRTAPARQPDQYQIANLVLYPGRLPR
jgi:hypothetical protein